MHPATAKLIHDDAGTIGFDSGKTGGQQGYLRVMTA